MKSVVEIIEKVNKISISSKKECENFRVEYLGVNGVIKGLWSDLHDIECIGSKRVMSNELIDLKNLVESKIVDFKYFR